MKKLAFGVAISVISLWGGFYLESLLRVGHWALSPMIITATAMFWGGMVLAVTGAMEL